MKTVMDRLFDHNKSFK